MVNERLCKNCERLRSFPDCNGYMCNAIENKLDAMEKENNYLNDLISWQNDGDYQGIIEAYEDELAERKIKEQ